MNLNSERHQSQVYIENLLGCSDPKDLKQFEAEIDALILSDETALDLNHNRKIDIVALFEKSLLAYASAISDIETGQKLWPIVKLYYATYYSVRAELLAKNIVVFRAHKVFTITPQKDAKLERFNNKEKSDHSLTFELAKRKLGERDILQSNSIDEVNCYEWLMAKRNWYQYKRREAMDISENFIFKSLKNNISDDITLFIQDDTPIYCFSPESACLAIPTKRIQLTHKNLQKLHLKVRDEFKSQLENAIKEKAASTVIQPFLI